MAISTPASNTSPVYKAGGVGGFQAAGTSKKKETKPKVSPTSTPYDITKDPLAALLIGSAESAAQTQRAQQQQSLAQQLTGITGPSGTIQQIMQNSAMDQRRLADEMAYRGILSSGIYSGEDTGIGTLLQRDYSNQLKGERQKVETLKDPGSLLDQGLRVNAQGAIEPIAPGDQVLWTDPATGEAKVVNFDWKLHTSAGRKAVNDALSQALAAYISSRTDLNA
jgi:hypothetical protein